MGKIGLRGAHCTSHRGNETYGQSGNLEKDEGWSVSRECRSVIPSPLKELCDTTADTEPATPARGPLVHEEALVEALESGKGTYESRSQPYRRIKPIVKRAAIDVFEFEPEISPGLRKNPNVVGDLPLLFIPLPSDPLALDPITARRVLHRYTPETHE